MKIITAVFDYPGETEYRRCVKALENSVKINAPAAEFVCIELEPPKECYPWNKPGWHNNHIKLEAYSKVKIDQPTFFVDADTVLLKNPADLISDNFDIAIAARPEGAKAPFNMGVVLFMPGHNSESFMMNWIDTDTAMLLNYNFHQEWRYKYLGQNQAAFGFLYELVNNMSTDILFKKFPTRIMNACEQDWGDLLETYFLHVKTRLRKAALGDKPISSLPLNLREGSKLWREYENIG